MRPAPVLCLLGVLACRDPKADEPRGSFIFIEDIGTSKQDLEPDVQILYLNRCRGGCTLTQGQDDSRQNTSSIISGTVTLSEFPHEDKVWKQTLRCVQEMYAPFEIQVTDQDPGDVPHVESIVAGHPRDLGMAGAAGVSPFTCGVILNGINYTFAEVIGHPTSLCYTVAQESGHTFGLDHQLLCDDPMTYLPSCGEKEFRRVDAECGEHDPRDCYCGGTIQNSYLGLLQILGPRVTPIDYTPLVDIVVPYDEEEVEPRFRVFAEIDDDEEDPNVEAAELYIDGVLIGTTTTAPWGFRTPDDLSVGEHEITVRAWDRAGQEDADTITVTVVPAQIRPDAGFFDAGPNPGRPPRPAPDAGVADAADTGALETSGGCAAMPPGATSPLLLAGLFLAWRRRR